jgi:hypothetical protein
VGELWRSSGHFREQKTVVSLKGSELRVVQSVLKMVDVDWGRGYGATTPSHLGL